MRHDRADVLVSEPVLTSHPSACLLALQSAKPAAQIPLQTLEPQVGTGMWLDEQTIPHEPQLLASELVLTSQPSFCLLPLQSANPAPQFPLQTPEPQVGTGIWLDEQTIPQELQLLGSA